MLEVQELLQAPELLQEPLIAQLQWVQVHFLLLLLPGLLQQVVFLALLRHLESESDLRVT